MDWVNVCSNGMEFLKKYRYVALILLAGLILMMLPEGGDNLEEEAPQLQNVSEEMPKSLQDSLAEILGQIEGAGKVKVLLTESAGEQTLYQIDEDITTGTETSKVQRETVVITGSDRSESGLVQQINPPTYLGAIVLCQGADSAVIRLSIVEAVADATGLSSDKISVLKMK